MITTTLAKFVDRICSERSISAYDIAKRSGGEISAAHAQRIRTGKVSNPTNAKLKALAKGLGITKDELYTVLAGKEPDANTIIDPRLHRMGRNYKKLKARDKQAVDPLLDLLDREIQRLLRLNGIK